ERKMAIVSTKIGFAAAGIFAASFGFTSLTQAAPIAGIPAAVRMTQAPSAPPEKAYHHDEDYNYRKRKKHKYHHEYPDHHSYDHSYDHHRGHRHHPLHHVHRFLGHLLHDNHY